MDVAFVEAKRPLAIPACQPIDCFEAALRVAALVTPVGTGAAGRADPLGGEDALVAPRH